MTRWSDVLHSMEEPLGTEDRTCEGCGHVFQTRRQRVEHERKSLRGDRVLCPCGDVCHEAEVTDV